MRFLKQYFLSISISIVAFSMCMMDTTELPSVEMTDFDKLVHFLMFGGLAGLVFFESSRYFRYFVSPSRIVWGVFIFPLLFGGGIELVQEYFSSTRTGDWLDFFYDGLGVLLATIVCWIINRNLQRK